jgi:hypothetical protein
MEDEKLNIEIPEQVSSEAPPSSPKSTNTEGEPSLREEIMTLLKEKKKLSSISTEVYLRNLKKLNSDKTLVNFSFLENSEEVMKKLDSFKDTTKRNYLISIVSILSLYPQLKALHDIYHGLMMQKKSEISDKDSLGMRSETQEENWMDWNSVIEQQKILGAKVDIFYKKRSCTPEDFLTLTAYLIISLYTLIPPRRNKDYSLMRVVNNYTPDLDVGFNYYDCTKKKFIFNNYKTSKKYGRYDLSVPNALKTVINKYLKHRAAKFALDDNENKPFLIKPDGTAMEKSNDITKVLNKVFGKAIGSSMLRHIFLTDKYSTTFKNAKLDAEMMAHSSGQQKEYIKEKLTVTF